MTRLVCLTNNLKPKDIQFTRYQSTGQIRILNRCPKLIKASIKVIKCVSKRAVFNCFWEEQCLIDLRVNQTLSLDAACHVWKVKTKYVDSLPA